MENGKPRILLAEDDPNLSTLLEEYLQFKGFDVVLRVNGEEALETFKKEQFDLCLLDVMMPKKDGFTLARDIKRIDKNAPIIFLTAKSVKEDKIMGFDIGADDYITKPFSMEELLARVNAVLRRTKYVEKDEEEPKIYNFGIFEFDHNHQLLKAGEKPIHLTTKESDLLKLLVKHQNNVVERETALMKIWGNDSYFTARSMDVFITKLRKYLKEDPDVQIINIHGTGYKLTVKD